MFRNVKPCPVCGGKFVGYYFAGAYLVCAVDESCPVHGAFVGKYLSFSDIEDEWNHKIDEWESK